MPHVILVSEKSKVAVASHEHQNTFSPLVKVTKENDYYRIEALEDIPEKTQILEEYPIFVANKTLGMVNVAKWTEHALKRVADIVNFDPIFRELWPRDGTFYQKVQSNVFQLAKDHLALYDTTSKINHCCVPNCDYFIEKQGQIRVWTTELVKKGEELTINYFPDVPDPWRCMGENIQAPCNCKAHEK
jgi:hypothetical protein